MHCGYTFAYIYLYPTNMFPASCMYIPHHNIDMHNTISTMHLHDEVHLEELLHFAFAFCLCNLYYEYEVEKLYNAFDYVAGTVMQLSIRGMDRFLVHGIECEDRQKISMHGKDVAMRTALQWVEWLGCHSIMIMEMERKILYAT